MNPLAFGRAVLLVVMISLPGWALPFQNVVSLGDSLLDDPDDVRSPVAAEHVANQLGVPLTKFAEYGSTSTDLIRDGQHTRAAAQFGEGDLAMLWIGGNDFFESVLGITFGFYGFLDDLEANVDAALTTLRGAGLEVAVFNLPDLSNVPATDFIANMRKATLMWNTRLENLAATHGATVIDSFELFKRISADPTEFSLLGKTPIVDDPPLLGDCPLCVFADSVHPSSFAQGFIANEAIATLNAVFDPDGAMPIEELTLVEIAELAEVYAGDVNGDNKVSAGDLAFWQTYYGGNGIYGDADGDTDGADFLYWQQQLGLGDSGASLVGVPEPTSFAFMLLFAPLFLGCRIAC